MNNRPRDPQTARNKNVLVVGGSGSGKTRFFIKPNLMQCHSSYAVSYTHLDVYKRQGFGTVENAIIRRRSRSQPCSGFFRQANVVKCSLLHWLEAVSYTHLDVYKRQVHPKTC